MNDFSNFDRGSTYGDRVSDYDIDFEELCAAAMEGARYEHQRQFVSDMEDKYAEYGENMYLSEA
jgi:hypothetical protein